jgi:Icc-related predicted phosphoesterase
MKIVLLSDTHCRLRKIEVPEGDLLLHAGDLTFQGNIQEIGQELRELGRIAKRFKYGCVFICGNHDWLGERNPELMRQMAIDNGLTWLNHESIKIGGLNIFGSAFTPEFCNWAFNVDRAALKPYWDAIPDDTNILITHGPPMGILDEVERYNGAKCEFESERVGCYDLMQRCLELKQLKHHVFGHIHKWYGHKQFLDVHYWNASNCDDRYKSVNEPLVIEIEET